MMDININKIDRDLVDMAMDKVFYSKYFSESFLPGDLARHYVETGWRNGFDPAPWFSSGQYLNRHPELVGGKVSPFAHYLVENGQSFSVEDVNDADDVALISKEFDADFYTSQLGTDIGLLLADPLRNYLHRGWRRGLNPARWFATEAYLEDYPDVAEAGVNPFVHYLRNGRLEGRIARAVKAEADIAVEADTPVADDIKPYTPEMRSVVSRDFNAAFYLSNYPDVAAAGEDPLDHYMQQGWKEGRDPNPLFCTQHYVSANPDVIEAGVHPFFHYVVAGKAEGRTPKHELGFRFDILCQLKSAEEQLRITKAYAIKKPPEPIESLRSKLGAFFDEASDFILSFSHDDFTANVGGVQLMLRREMRELMGNGFAHINLFPATALPFVEPDDRNLVLGLILNGELSGYYSSQDVAQVFAELKPNTKNAVKSSFVVHHLLGHNLSAVVDILRALNFQEGYYWLHDYAALYNKWNLMRNDVQYGGPPKRGSRNYELCIYTQAEFDHVKEYAQLFDSFTVHLISPSQAALNIWLESGLQKTASQTVLPHCELVAERRAQALQRDNPSKLRIGYLGFPVNHKGWPVFRELALRFGDDERYEFYYLGVGCPAGLGINYIEVTASEDSPYVMRDAVASAEIDVVFAWSLCPETFSLVAYEALAGGALLIANPDGGNIPAIIKDFDCGLVVEDENALPRLMQENAFAHMSRQKRDVKNYDLKFSRMLGSILTGNAQ